MTDCIPRLRHAIALLPYILIATALASSSARADYISLSGAENAPNVAEIYVLDDRVRLVLEVYVDDLAMFEPLIPQSMYADTATAAPLASREALFAEKIIRVVDDTGTALPARFTLVETRMRVDRRSPFTGMINPTTRRRVPGPPEDKRVLYAEVEYPFQGPRPSRLTFVPPLDEDGNARVTIGFIAYHDTVPIIDFRYLGKPAHLNVDWNDPWYSRFDNRNLIRHNRSAIASFLYVESFEVRHEMLVRVRDMSALVELGIGNLTRIPAAEAEGVKQKIANFLVGQNKVSIDGKMPTPTIDRVEFVVLAQRGIQTIDPSKDIDLNTATVGVIFAYAVDGMPQQVAVNWDVFPERVGRITAMATDPAGPLQSILTPEDHVLEWKNFLKSYQPPSVSPVQEQGGNAVILLTTALLAIFALAAMALAIRSSDRLKVGWTIIAAIAVSGAAVSSLFLIVGIPPVFRGPPDEANAVRIVNDTVQNLHLAARHRDEADTRGELRVSVSPEALEQILPEARRALFVKGQGGGRASIQRISDVTAKEIQDRGSGRFTTVAGWVVTASIGHWGHFHKNRLRFRALLDLAPVDGHWKLTGLSVLEARLIAPSSTPPPSR